MYVILGEISHKHHFIDDLEEDVSNYIEAGEPPPDELLRTHDNQNSIINPQTQSYTYKQRYTCHSCEPPDCTNQGFCRDAIQVSEIVKNYFILKFL